jgi:hypothetical protein
MHHLRFGLMTVLLLLSCLGFALGGPWAWTALVFNGGGVVLGDLLGPDETSTFLRPRERVLNAWLFLCLPLLLGMHVLLWWLAGTGDPLGLGAWVQRLTGHDLFAARQAMTSLSWFGAILGAGLVTAAAGTNVGHELVHRTRQPAHMAWGRWLLAFTFDASFSIEHVHGHHARVSTCEDPATARRGQWVYGFIFSSTWGQLVSAWRLEAGRLARKRLPLWSRHNRFLRGWVMSATLAAAAFTVGRGRGLVLFVATGLFGKAVLETINFVEHYGLVRLPGMKVEPRHSWNSNAWMSSTVLYNLTRHSDHHAEGSKPFWRLRPLPEAPMLPTGYMGMILLALVPPLYRHVMAPRLRQWDQAYADPSERDLALAESRRSGWAELKAS